MFVLAACTTESKLKRVHQWKQVFVRIERSLCLNCFLLKENLITIRFQEKRYKYFGTVIQLCIINELLINIFTNYF
jgi:hypothetical protein